MKTVLLIIAILVMAILCAVSILHLNGLNSADEQDGVDIQTPEQTQLAEVAASSSYLRTVTVSKKLELPLAGSAPTVNVKHNIDPTEIRQGCFRQDCIRSVDAPQFIGVDEGRLLLDEESLGIALSYKGIERFYPFAMLGTREIVNDVLAGDALLITYCPLCGTGIVFDRMIDGIIFEFGVSGMLWQSNLLMYDRASSVEDRNLWSQVLGEAVVGNATGDRLRVVPSDIMKFADWVIHNPDGKVLDTGSIRDPYNGNFYDVARQFGPDFDAATSPLPPMAYVYGIEVSGVYKAYTRDTLPVGDTIDVVAGVTIQINRSKDGAVTFISENGAIDDIEGFWFSWAAAHQDTLLWIK